MPKYGHDIICRPPVGERLPNKYDWLVSTFELLDEFEIAELAEGVSLHNSPVIRCRECGHTWQTTISSFQLFASRENQAAQLRQHPNQLRCLACSHQIDPDAISTRYGDNHHSKGTIFKRSADKLGVGYSDTTYRADFRRIRIAKKEAEKLDKKEWFMNKNRYWRVTKILVIVKTQVLRWISISERGIFYTQKTTEDGRLRVGKGEHPLLNITYQPEQFMTQLSSILNHPAESQMFLLPREEREARKAAREIEVNNFLLEVIKLIGYTGDNTPSPHDICTAFLYKRKPLLRTFKFTLNQLKSYRLGKNQVNNPEYKRYSRILALNKDSHPTSALVALTGTRLQKSVRKALVSITLPGINWPLARAAVHGIKDPNFVAPFVATHCGLIDHRSEVFKDGDEAKAVSDLTKIVCDASGPRAASEMLADIAVAPHRRGELTVDSLQMLLMNVPPQADPENDDFAVRIAQAYREFPGAAHPTIHALHDWLIGNRRAFYQNNADRDLPEAFTYNKQQLKLESEFNGFQFILPRFRKELNDWGDKMHNCIRGYARRVLQGNSLLVGVLNPEKKLVANIELQREASGGLATHQVKGFCNKTLISTEESGDQELNNAIKGWLKTHTILFVSA